MPLILELIKANWKPLFAVTCVVLFGIGCYNKGKETVRGEWDKATALAIIDAREIEHENAATTNKVGTDYEKRKADIDAGFNGVLDILLAGTDGYMPSKTDPARSIDAKTCASRIPQANARKLAELAKEAEINTAKLIALQAWVSEIY